MSSFAKMNEALVKEMQKGISENELFSPVAM